MIKAVVVQAVLVSVAVVGLAVAVKAQTPAAVDAAPRLRLGLGDLMTAFMQPRHAKLGLAGQARNWPYLAYERREFEETLELIERMVPRYRGTAMSDLLQVLKEPMASLDAAIKAKDGAGYDAAYARLTEGCNACHVATDHKMVVIQIPKASTFPNQNFAPQTE
ncbi:hypothetical protein SAMN02745126_00500 [Enhydrobacter aerosaccus]|uniref:Cytochrome C n=1 Tax=Enhydrobacter aerosaccus TaxID=225324 RepID=A0A1T4JVB2_9HYPH|nr:hypothetical protein [Enhydrobacter aerosaccus]SJZ34088.1 hypothetical protein SAMN02745126_00500 [Enhydrobacter aerosaccus]